MVHRFLDHTADLAVELEAASLPELFVAALEAFTDAIVELRQVRPREGRRLVAEAADRELLLVSWLEEALYAFEVDGLLFRTATVEILPREGGGLRLEAEARGEPYDPRRHPLKVLIKGITYHGLEVLRRDGGWTGRLIFDI